MNLWVRTLLLYARVAALSELGFSQLTQQQKLNSQQHDKGKKQALTWCACNREGGGYSRDTTKGNDQSMWHWWIADLSSRSNDQKKQKHGSTTTPDDLYDKWRFFERSNDQNIKENKDQRTADVLTSRNDSNRKTRSNDQTRESADQDLTLLQRATTRKHKTRTQYQRTTFLNVKTRITSWLSYGEQQPKRKKKHTNEQLTVLPTRYVYSCNLHYDKMWGKQTTTSERQRQQPWPREGRQHPN